MSELARTPEKFDGESGTVWDCIGRSIRLYAMFFFGKSPDNFVRVTVYKVVVCLFDIVQ